MSRTGKWLSNVFVIAGLTMLVGIAGVRWEFMSLQIALLVASVGAVILFVYGVLLAPVLLFKLIRRKPVSGATLATCLLGLLPVGVLLLSVGSAGLRSPAIHDIATDTENPPEFVLAAEQRKESDNSAIYEGEVIARLQQEAYPEIRSLRLEQSPTAVQEAVVAVAQDQGWEVLGSTELQDDSGTVVVEAVASSAIFGFKDDIAIRIAPLEQGVQVDVRSASRVGLGDLGANARRITVFSAKLEEKFLK